MNMTFFSIISIIWLLWILLKVGLEMWSGLSGNGCSNRAFPPAGSWLHVSSCDLLRFRSEAGSILVGFTAAALSQAGRGDSTWRWSEGSRECFPPPQPEVWTALSIPSWSGHSD